MFFIANHVHKVIFGWSPKSGCTHIKRIAHFLDNGKIDNKIHTFRDMHVLPSDISSYTTILVIRNPFERLVSGFFEKYNSNGEYNYMWKIEKKLTFTNFVDELIALKWDIIQKYHFIPQTTGHFNYDKIKSTKKLILFDINSIDYPYIEALFQKSIPEVLLTFRGGHENKKRTPFEKPVYDLEIYQYENHKVPIESYYNKTIYEKVKQFYVHDLLFFNEFGFNYES